MNALLGPNHDTALLLVALVAVIALVVLIARFKLNAFLALILASLFVGVMSGMNLSGVARSFQEGVGRTLGFVAIVVGLGTILGKMLAESGGAEVVAATFIRWLGEKRLPWTMMIVGFVVGLPVFFGVGLVLLVPVLFTLIRETRRPLLSLGIPLVAGLSISHGLVPPHPGPLTAIDRLQADIGKTILYALIVSIPTAVVAGPFFGTLLARRVTVEPGGIGAQLTSSRVGRSQPGFGVTLFTILLPVVLMSLATLAELTLSKASPFRSGLVFLGQPLVSLSVAVLVSFWSFGAARGFSRQEVLKFTEDCVAPAASILLIVGAGGGFSRVLEESGVGGAIEKLARGWPFSPLVLGWLTAALIRVAVGSATVAITMAGTILSPIAAGAPELNRELLVLAMGAGSLFLSHLNDGGFWFVKEYFNMTVPQTLQTWTVMETILAVVALGCVLLLDLIV